MDYNTQRKKLALPEYGRNIQTMVDYLLTIEDREKRTEQAHVVIEVMGNLNPQLRDLPDFRHKLWDHLAIMADFKLDIDSPYPLPERSKFQSLPDKIPYSSGKIKARHYGKTVEKMVEKIKEIEDPDERRAMIALTANHMKKSYLTWNRDSVEDAQIINDINSMYGEELIPSEGFALSDDKELLQKRGKGAFKAQSGKQQSGNKLQSGKPSNGKAQSGKSSNGKRRENQNHKFRHKN